MPRIPGSRRRRNQSSLAPAPAPRLASPLPPALVLCFGRTYASADDVRAVAKPVLRHRLILHYQARLEGLAAGDSQPGS